MGGMNRRLYYGFISHYKDFGAFLPYGLCTDKVFCCQGFLSISLFSNIISIVHDY